MKEKIKLAIEGYNEEKAILTKELSLLNGDIQHIPRRGSIEERLSKIDKNIKDILNIKD